MVSSDDACAPVAIKTCEVSQSLLALVAASDVIIAGSALPHKVIHVEMSAQGRMEAVSWGVVRTQERERYRILGRVCLNGVSMDGGMAMSRLIQW